MNIPTDGNSRIDRTLNMLKNMDDWMLHAKNIQELETKLVKFLEFAKSKNLKLKRSKFMVGSEIEFEGSIVTVEKVQNQDLIFITPKTKRIRALEELRRPQTKKDCQVYAGMISSSIRWNPIVALEIPLIRKACASKGRFIWSDEMQREWEITRS